MTTQRITWIEKTRTSASGEVGRVGNWKLFDYSWSAMRNETEKPWRLVTTLPLKMKESRFGSEAEAKQYAERVLASFVKKLGAAFLDQP